MLNPGSILLVRTDRIGELILTTPAFRALRRTFPQAKITLLVRPSSYEAVEGNPDLDSIIKIDPAADLDNLRKGLGFISFVRGLKAGMSVVFNPSKFFNVALFAAGVPIRAGYDRKMGFLLNRKIPDRKYLCEKHEVEYNLELAGTVGAVASDTAPYFPLPDDWMDRASGIFKANGLGSDRPIVAIHPATSNPEKSWPPERFARLSDMISGESGVRVAIIGGREEAGVSRAVISATKTGAADLTGRISLKDTASVLKKCALLVSCDSGPVHVSAAVGTPVVALFGESRSGGSAVRWGPYGEAHIVVKKPKVVDISVEDVFDAVRSKLCAAL